MSLKLWKHHHSFGLTTTAQQQIVTNGKMDRERLSTTSRRISLSFLSIPDDIPLQLHSALFKPEGDLLKSFSLRAVTEIKSYKIIKIL